MGKDYRCVIFDLDGTLVDTSPGILQALRQVEAEEGLAPLPDGEAQRFIGPPLLESMMRYYRVDEARGLALIGRYREIYRADDMGFRRAEVYPLVGEILDLLHRRGAAVAVATLKQVWMARRTLELHGLLDRFDMIVGCPPEGDRSGAPKTKGEQITYILEQQGIPPGAAVMIGDSPYDGVGAGEAGVDFAAQLYGYGFSHDPEPGEYPVAFSARTPEELYAFLRENI